jgi:hypothetical protein
VIAREPALLQENFPPLAKLATLSNAIKTKQPLPHVALSLTELLKETAQIKVFTIHFSLPAQLTGCPSECSDIILASK